VTHPIRARLTAGSAFLKTAAASKGITPDVAAGLQDVAADIDAVLAPRGWTMLREGTPAGSTSALSLTMTKALKEAFKSAEADFAAPLGALAEEGFRAALEGWLPPKTLKRRSRTAQEAAAKATERAVLQLQVDDVLRKQVEKVLPKLTKTAGYPVTLSSIAISWIADQLGVDRPTADNLGSLGLVMPKPLLEHVLSAAEARGTTVDKVLEDGVRDMLNGTRVPQISDRPRTASGTWTAAAAPVERGKLTVSLDAELLEAVRERAGELNETAPRPVHPGTIAIALLKDRLGEPDGV
jgi:hypothetical protein